MQPRTSRGVVTVLLAAMITSACGGSSNVDLPEQDPIQAAEVNGLARDIDPCPEPDQRADPADGERLPAMDLPCLGPGASVVDPAEPTGRPTLVNLWATWCGPCRKEMPALQDAYENHVDEVLFLGVDTRDDPRRAAEFLRELGVTYPQVVDGEGLLLEELRIRGLPVTVMLDADGLIVDRHVGPIDRESIDELIRQAGDRTTY
jgi:cytochrome c biogenesis protein CcmG/thiol:disulfide interchange protein DsbE